MGDEGILTQCVQGEDYSSQAKPLKKPECAEHCHVHWECHSQSKYQNEYDREEQYGPSTYPKNKEETVLKARTDTTLQHYKEGHESCNPFQILSPILKLVPFLFIYF